MFYVHSSYENLYIAENKLKRKLWFVKYVFIVYQEICWFKYWDIGSAADSKAKYYLYFLIMILERFKIIYLSFETFLTHTMYLS